MENVSSEEIFGAKRYANTMHYAPKLTENKAPPEYRKPKCLLFNCWLEEPYKKCEPCRRACAEVDEK